MSFLEKLKSRKLSKLMAAAVVGGSFLFGGGDALAATNTDGMFQFRQSYLAAPPDNRAFRQVISFFGGTVFQADINSEGLILSDASMRMSGTLNWTYTSPKTKQTKNISMPFYIMQDGDSDMSLFVQRNRKWSKMALPGFPSALANAFKTTDPTIMQENMKAVKEAKIFKDDANQRILQLVIDGDYAADLLAKYDDKNADGAIANSNLKKALRENDAFITWTVNKNTGKTVTTVIELTDIMRSFARGMLDDSAAGKVKLTQEEMSLLDAIGYYSEFHYSITYHDDADSSIDAPANVMKAAENDSILDDLADEMVAVVK